MPTAADYRASAAALEALSGVSSSAQTVVTSVTGATGIEGGRFAEGVDGGLGDTAVNLGTIVARCTDGAAEANSRAIVCEMYTDAFRRWQNQMASWSALDPEQLRPPRPLPPVRPAPWAEVG